MSNSVCVLQQKEVNGNWNGPVSLGGVAVQLSATQNTDNRLQVFWTDPSNQSWYNWQNPDGSWPGPNPFGNAKQIAVAVDGAGRLVVCWIQTDDRVFVGHKDGPTGFWNTCLDSPGQAKQVTLHKNVDGNLQMMFIGLDGFIYNCVLSFPSNKDPWIGLVKTQWAAKQITLGQNADGRLEFFYVGLNDLIYHGWQNAPNGTTWSEHQLSGGAKYIAAGNNSDGRITIFYVGLDGYIYHNSQLSANSSGWGGDIRAFQGPYYDGGAVTLTLGRNQDGRLQLFYEGTDGYMYSTWESTPNGAWTGGSKGPHASAFSAITDSSGLITLFYVGDAGTS